MEGMDSILIVEDMDNWRSFLGDVLVDDYNVTHTSSYEEAYNVLVSSGRHRFSLAIVDLRLNMADAADRGGLELLRKVAELSIPAIVLTGYASIRTAKEAFRDLGAADYIDKSSFDVADFREAVRSAIQRSIR